MKTFSAALMACLLSTAPVMGLTAGKTGEAPLTRRMEPTPDLGDGFYVLTYDDSGTIANYTFTPMDELDIPESEDGTDDWDEDDEDTGVTRRESVLEKRAGTTCGSTFGKRGPIGKAKACLRKTAGGQHYSSHTTAQCIRGHEKAFLCNYQAQFVSHKNIHNLQTTVDAECGVLKNGFTRCTNDCGVSDLAVGRTKKATDICGF